MIVTIATANNELFIRCIFISSTKVHLGFSADYLKVYKLSLLNVQKCLGVCKSLL